MIPANFSEHHEQVTVVQWLERRGYVVFAVPNGGKRSIATATQLKREGVRKGAPDLVVVNRAPANGEPTMIEMKRKKDARYSPEQLALHAVARQQKWNVLAPEKGQSAQWVIDQLQSLGY
jgi:hypothetical protein